MAKEMFEKTLLSGCPNSYPAAEFQQDKVNAIFFDGPEYNGKPTRVFAYTGLPEGASVQNPVPGVVLIHGGGATALADWVRIWNVRGFAAIAMDNCGGVPCWSENPYCRKEGWPRHAHSGPAGWGRMEDSERPVQEQWLFHAVSSVLNGRKLLAAMPEVDDSHIGWTGISWGGVIGCIASGVESRFKFAIPVYGCGSFDTPESSLVNTGETEYQRKEWFKLWNPAHFLTSTAMPFLWVTGVNDPAFPLDRWAKSTGETAGTSLRSLRLDYVHNHTLCWQSETIFDFAKSDVLPRLSAPEIENRKVRMKFSGRKIVSAKLCFTRASGVWQDRLWRTVPAAINDDVISAKLPELTRSAFLQCFDEKGSLWSSAIF